MLLFRSPVSAAAVLQALLVGYAVNGALPARLGELFRADYLSRRSSRAPRRSRRSSSSGCSISWRRCPCSSPA